MRRRRVWVSVVVGLLLVSCQTASGFMGRGPAAGRSGVELHVGDPAPDFSLPDQNRKSVTLSQLRGHPVQVAFYVWAFSGG